MFAYEVKYENGASNFLHEGLAESLEDAIKISKESILGCMPEGFDPENLVRPVIARRYGFCALCSSDKELRFLKFISSDIDAGLQLCERCINKIKTE